MNVNSAHLIRFDVVPANKKDELKDGIETLFPDPASSSSGIIYDYADRKLEYEGYYTDDFDLIFDPEISDFSLFKFDQIDGIVDVVTVATIHPNEMSIFDSTYSIKSPSVSSGWCNEIEKICDGFLPTNGGTTLLRLGLDDPPQPVHRKKSIFSLFNHSLKVNEIAPLDGLLEELISDNKRFPPSVEEIYSNQDILYQSGFNRESYVSIINDGFVLSAQKPKSPWERLTAIDIRDEYQDSLFEPSWLRTYILPLMAYFRARNWQEYQLTKLDSFNSRLDKLQENIRSNDELNKMDNNDKNQTDVIDSYQNELESIQHDWIDRYSNATSIQQKIIKQANEMSGAFSESNPYEDVVDTPEIDYKFVDNRSLFTRYNEELSSNDDVIDGRISKVSTKKEEISKIISYRIDSLVSSTNIGQQKTSQQLNRWVVILTIVLTVFGAAGLAENLRMFSDTFVVIVIFLIFIEIVLMLLIERC